MSMGNFATWDIETKGFTGDMVIGGVFYEGNYYEFTEWANFVKIIHKNLPDKTTLYAHNGGKFDNRHFLEFIDNRDDIKLTHFLNINGSVVFTLTIKGKRFYFRDSLLHLNKSLKKLCVAFEVDSPKKEFNIKDWIKNRCPINEELRDYLYRDCVSLYQVLQKYFSIVETPKITIASTSFNICCKTTYKGVELEKLLKNFLTKDEEQFIRDSYRGGRTEVFRRYGAKELFHYDVNSLYPYVMKNREYPFGKHKIVTGDDKCKKLINSGKLGVIQCDISCPEMHYPYLALHYDEKLLFPVGNWNGIITTIEYEKCIKLGYTITIEGGIFYQKKGYLFNEFVDRFYEIKSNSQGAKRETAKLILNSAYGKYGQRRTFDEYITLDEIIEKQLDINEYEKVNSKFYKTKSEKYTNRKINPVIATFVTAYARDYLYTGIEQIQKSGGEVYYVDTDSIFTDIPLPNSWIHDKKLGYWALEDIANNPIFVAPKQYQYYDDEDKIIKLKGVSANHYDMLDMWDFEDKEHTKTFKSTRLTGFNEHFKRLDTDKQKYIGEIKIKKVVTARYSKRILLPNNYSTKPVYINQ